MNEDLKFQEKLLELELLELLVNYIVKLKGLEHDEGIKNPFLDLKDLKLTKRNKTHYAIDGIFNVVRDNIEKENFLVSITIAQKMGNGYQDSPLLQLKKQNFCSLWETEKFIMPLIKSKINDTNYQCPPKVVIYTVIDETLEDICTDSI
ncbi:uncharacterized protein LOC123295370 [Chrysoperla carnea]|uniref:uncharacterized protein LOC123295370 n=1 Tax=Chrysoperla carnea TaxID=189513 RepID=UPI001D08CD8A|nr:uncharacterized protein LOC123295370 [Chrysoperla carnea]